MTAPRIFFASCLLLAASSVWAGGGKEGVSRREGVFFTFLQGGYIGFDSLEMATDLQDYCAKGGFVHAHQRRARYKCKVELNGSFGRIEILGAPNNSNWDEELFSILPARRTKWEVRPLSQDELSGLTALVKASEKQYGNLARYVTSGKGFAVYKAEGKQITYIIPGRWIRDEEAFYEAQIHHVFVGNNQGTYRYQGQLPDKPERYFDLDGDSLPEIKTNTTCDGWCIDLWDISRGVKNIATFGGH